MRKGQTAIDLRHVKTAHQLHELLKTSLQLPAYYGMNWDAFKDAIRDENALPHSLILRSWASLQAHLPHDASMLRKLLDEFVSGEPDVPFRVEYD